VIVISSEEFGIYLQYVRKLGFEELPDYNFLQELFNKVLRNGGNTDDSVYDWKLLNDGKGWEVSSIFQLFFSPASCKYWFELWCKCVLSSLFHFEHYMLGKWFSYILTSRSLL
jgi:hypothetical protein